jgi:glycosyltransferase involved in cell wall biosynthesis
MVCSRGATKRVKVFVFLSAGLGAARWHKAWSAGTLAGLCEPLPYGYFHAASELWTITYSEDRDENAPTELFRKILRKIFGFDLIHAWYNRGGLLNSHIVWTHTEREYLAVLSLWKLLRPRNRPRLIAQSIWLFDRWQSFSSLRRWVYRRLISEADLLTALSPDNVSAARRLFPEKRCELVRFGIPVDFLTPVSKKQFHRPIRILSLGSDMHRDWETLVEAVRDWHEGQLIIANRTLRKRRSWPTNVSIIRPATAQDVVNLYGWADVVVVPLKPNLHASGITVIVEAVLAGVPVICTDTGGLRAYFNEAEVGYVKRKSFQAIRDKILEFAADDERRLTLIRCAQQRVLRDQLTSYGYAIRHRELSEAIFLRDPAEEEPQDRSAHPYA